MFKNIITILVIVGCAIGMVVVVVPRYKNMSGSRAKLVELQDTLGKATQLRAIREQLKNQYDSFTATQLSQLETLLPSHVDNVKFSAIDIKRLADQNGLVLKDANTIEPDAAVTNKGKEIDPLGRIDLEFSLAGSYAGFVSFLSQLERSLRIVDVRSVSFAQQPPRPNELVADQYVFDLVVSTYWLRSLD